MGPAGKAAVSVRQFGAVLQGNGQPPGQRQLERDVLPLPSRRVRLRSVRNYVAEHRCLRYK